MLALSAGNNNCGRGYPSAGNGGSRDQHSLTSAVGGGLAVDNEYCKPIKDSDDQELANGAPPYQ